MVLRYRSDRVVKVSPSLVEVPAVATAHETGKRVQAWVPAALHAELQKHAAAERRSLSSTIRIAVEDKLREAWGKRS